MILREPVETEYDQRLESCPLCRSSELTPFDRDARRGNDIDACRGCGVKFINPQYTDGDRQRFYTEYIDFEKTDAPGPEAPWRKQRWVRKECKRRSIEMIGRFVPKGRILSIGCSDGLEISVAQELGWTAEGFDVDPDATAEVARRYGATVHSGDFRDIEASPFDAILMDQVIEHVKNPGDYLSKISDLLRPGGILFFGAPNLSSLSNRAKTLIGKLGLRNRRRGKHYATRHHIFFFSPAVARDVLEKHYDFEVLLSRGSLKPQKKKIGPFLRRWFTIMDSGFITIARKLEQTGG